MKLREDLKLIYDWIPEHSHILDLGCGDGELLSALTIHKNCTGYGVEIAANHVQAAIERGVNVIQADIEEGLAIFGNHNFDVIVLSQTIQSMRDTQVILQNLTRIAKQAIVSFPNFGYWRNRLQIGLNGHMPVSERMPHQWYDTPNIHLCTLQDFELLCTNNQLRVLERAVMTGNKRIEKLPNLLGSLAFYRVG